MMWLLVILIPFTQLNYNEPRQPGIAIHFGSFADKTACLDTKRHTDYPLNGWPWEGSYRDYLTCKFVVPPTRQLVISPHL